MIDEKKLIEEIKDVEVAWYLDGNYTTYDSTTIMDIIEEQPKVDEWTSCAEELPDDESLLYWTTHEDESVVLHGWSKTNGFIYNWEVDDLKKRARMGNVIAWMPMFKPKPYKRK